MLEFQEGFFEHEIRDNFYVDATMKAVWAAEMEVLQRIAEVCDRHGIIWYAAYGTLWEPFAMRVSYPGMTIWISGLCEAIITG